MRALLAFVFCLLMARPVSAEIRLAPHIGNQDYNDAGGSLENLHWDIVGVAADLKDRAFEVAPLHGPQHDQLHRSVADYAAKFAKAGENAIGIFYYAGHGVAAGGTGAN